jgi:hypothetical protein
VAGLLAKAGPAVRSRSTGVSGVAGMTALEVRYPCLGNTSEVLVGRVSRGEGFQRVWVLVLKLHGT